ncbi:MAG: 5-formyltetrahydrofolate cyclo-ligase [Candidatus Polarisedimenticolaceae bacterium]|nr:5-formyltetrahydrofolate cyclo-ligase [Candidatus Polarisedimenticolaceae bacterium]
MIDKRLLRRQKRQLRRHLSKHDQRSHALDVARHLMTLPQFLRSRRVALYFSADGEIDTTPLLHQLRNLGKVSFYPALHNRPAPLLWFIKHQAGDPLIKNRFGISEPSIRRHQPTKPWALDVVILPLVAFDAECNRLGMGGGYYDRTFAYLKNRHYWRKPILIGVAHECQRVTQLESEAWDVPLDAVVTEERVYLPNS